MPAALKFVNDMIAPGVVFIYVRQVCLLYKKKQKDSLKSHLSLIKIILNNCIIHL
ncbi:hypothetical protein SAMN05428947_109153 [Mucilaginibacter sp. OK283]|nr:hypothetical protein SAMN05428947_109153 [Mucilaginibacter sp. OK283]